MSDKYNQMTFTLNPEQVEKLNLYMGMIRMTYGEYGKYQYTFSENSCGGYDVIITNTLHNTPLILN